AARASRHLIFDAAAHAEQRVELVRGLEPGISQDHVADAAAIAGHEAAVSASARMERPMRVDLRAVEDLDRIAGRIIEAQHVEHAPRAREGFAPELELHTGFLQ